MESAWANGKPAYRCRHGHTTASTRGPGRLKNAYIREDRILPHLPALHVLLTGAGTGAAERRRRRTRSGADVRPPFTAEDATAPRGPVGPTVRRYLLAGLLACGRCGRRLESAWSNGKPAYRCRHGYTSATGPSPDRPANLYVREDQILPRLAALAILQAGSSGCL